MAYVLYETRRCPICGNLAERDFQTGPAAVFYCSSCDTWIEAGQPKPKEGENGL